MFKICPIKKGKGCLLEKSLNDFSNTTKGGKDLLCKEYRRIVIKERWQLDHIIPHSEFKYISVENEVFKKCWALENLRPYSAKQNLLDGVNKTRHNNTEII